MKTGETDGAEELRQLGYTNIPTIADIQPTKREQALLDSLFQWRIDSERSGIVIENPNSELTTDEPNL